MKKILVGIPILVVFFWLIASFTILPKMAIEVPEKPVTRSPAEVGLRYEDLSLSSEGVRLAGWWIPAPEPRATLMFVHGAGSNRTSEFTRSLALYRALVDLGVSVITVDLRNHGNSERTDGTLGMGPEEWPDVLAMSRWLDQGEQRALPRLIMGASMGGATTIHAIANGLSVNAAILLDPALDTPDTLIQGAWINSGWPPVLFKTYAWATTRFYGLPSGESDALAIGATLTTPTLIIQDPDDPITRLPFARALAAENSYVSLIEAPKIPQSADCIKHAGRWGTHVRAFSCHPEWTTAQLDRFIGEQIVPQVQVQAPKPQPEPEPAPSPAPPK